MSRSYDDLIAQAPGLPEPPIDRRAENRRRVVEAVARRIGAQAANKLHIRLVGSAGTGDGRIDVRLTPGDPLSARTVAVLDDVCRDLFGRAVRSIVYGELPRRVWCDLCRVEVPYLATWDRTGRREECAADHLHGDPPAALARFDTNYPPIRCTTCGEVYAIAFEWMRDPVACLWRAAGIDPATPLHPRLEAIARAVGNALAAEQPVLALPPGPSDGQMCEAAEPARGRGVVGDAT